MKATPEGFTIGFCRHGNQRWRWKQQFPDDSGRDKTRSGFRSRTAALRDLEAEIKIRQELAKKTA